MKKTYNSPLIEFESFELAANITAGCELLLVNSTEGVCPVSVTEWGGMTFISGNYGCDRTPPGGEDTICYHVPTADNNVFNS